MTDKLDLESKDLIAEKLEQLQQLFPNLVTEGENGKVLDLDQLKNEFSTEVVEGTKERYRLEWPGKKEAIVTANLPTTKTLRPVKEDSVDFDNTENLYIEGDNLEVLKILQESYFGKIKMIYIDPPYNTGNDFVYKDNFSKDAKKELKESGQKDEYNQRLFQNVDTSGRYHSDWLSMMYPRVKLARNLLSNDGLIFISIDDIEAHNLKKICDEIFSEKNLLANLIWDLPRGNNAGVISRAHEHILVYAKNKKDIKNFKRSGGIQESIDRCNKNVDSRHPASQIVVKKGIRYEGADAKLSGRIGNNEWIDIDGEMLFEDGKLKNDVKLTAGWTMKDMFLRWQNGEEVYDLKGQKIAEFFFKENGRIYSKKISDKESLKSILKGVGDTQNGNEEMVKIFGKEVFSHPKPHTLLEFLINLHTAKNDIILDFFAGTSSTAHAVFKSNLSDGGKRVFILNQIQEDLIETNKLSDGSGKKSVEKAIEFLEDLGKAPYLSELGKERMKRSTRILKDDARLNLTKLKTQLTKEKNPKAKAELEQEVLNSEFRIKDTDYGFRVYRLDESNMADVYHTPQDYDQDKLDLFADNVKPDRSADDLLAQIMLDWGLPLSLPIDDAIISGKRVFHVAGNSLLACFDSEIDEAFAKEIAKEEPLRIVFKDAGFASDTAKSNVKQLLKQLSPETEMKVI